MARTVQFTTDGFDDLGRLFAKWRHNVADATGPFNEMAGLIAENQKAWFNSSGGGTWALRKEPYHSYMRRKFPKRKVMHGPDTKNHRGLQLRDELTRRKGGGNARGTFGIEKITPHSMTVGTKLPYAALHDEGVGRLPVRKLMAPVDQATVTKMTKILQAHIVGERLGR